MSKKGRGLTGGGAGKALEADRLDGAIGSAHTTAALGCKPETDDALQRFSDAAGAFDTVIIDQPKMLAVAAAAMSGGASDLRLFTLSKILLSLSCVVVPRPGRTDFGRSLACHAKEAPHEKNGGATPPFPHQSCGGRS
jgi:hypothetical protein